MIKRKGLKTKLQFEFETDIEVPDLNYEISLHKSETNKTKNKINIVKIKRVKRDSSTNVNLF